MALPGYVQTLNRRLANPMVYANQVAYRYISSYIRRHRDARTGGVSWHRRSMLSTLVFGCRANPDPRPRCFA